MTKGLDTFALICYNIAMIKLVACDLDGTLLPPTKILPERTFSLIEDLHKKGILFVPASGRQLPNLLKQFAPVADKIAVIAENGGLVWQGGKIIYSNPTPAQDVAYALKVIRAEPNLYPLLSCDTCAYHEDDYAPFVEISAKSYSSMQKVDCLDDILPSVTALKISVWDPLLAAEHGGKILPQKIKGLRSMVSGIDWLDVSVATANKGEALKALLAHLDVSADECMAFGDHMNDLEMLLTCGHPYVPENGFYALKERIVGRVESNANFGVIKKLEELL